MKHVQVSMRSFDEPQSDVVDTLECIMMNLWGIARKLNYLLLLLPVYEPPLSSRLIGFGICVCFEEMSAQNKEKKFW